MRPKKIVFPALLAAFMLALVTLSSIVGAQRPGKIHIKHPPVLCMHVIFGRQNYCTISQIKHFSHHFSTNNAQSTLVKYCLQTSKSATISKLYLIYKGIKMQEISQNVVICPSVRSTFGFIPEYSGK